MNKYLLFITLILISNTLLSQTETFDAIGIGITPDCPLNVFEKYGQGHSITIDAETNANPNRYFKSNGQSVANIRYYDR